MNKFLTCMLLITVSCKQEKPQVTFATSQFTVPVKVTMLGYTANMMEPFISRDGTTLLFNNLNQAPENTNLHWSTRINDSTFQYQGEIAGINTALLEAVPSLDTTGTLYFVSNRSYSSTLSTIYSCKYKQGQAVNIQLVTGISKLQTGRVNFDVEVSADGQTLYFVDSQLDGTGNPLSADLVVAIKTQAGFQRSQLSSTLMRNINSEALEYAACISVDQKALYFTRVSQPATSGGSMPGIYLATRQNTSDPFGIPQKITSITGFAEAPTLAPDQKTLYFHKKDGAFFSLYFVRKI